MASRSHSASTTLTAFDAAIPGPAERREAGKALRSAVPRNAQGVWEPASDRRDPIEVLVEQNKTRDQNLVPLRWERMAVSPFTFLRGSALVMAHDLATTSTAGIDVRLCGDAHIANFGTSPALSDAWSSTSTTSTRPGPVHSSGTSSVSRPASLLRVARTVSIASVVGVRC